MKVSYWIGTLQLNASIAVWTGRYQNLETSLRNEEEIGGDGSIIHHRYKT